MNDITALALLVSKAKASVFTMEYISQFEASDIDSDDVDLRFEVDGVETGTNVSIVDECGQAAQMITALVEALEKAHTERDEFRNRLKLEREILEGADKRIAELESRAVTVNLPPEFSAIAENIRTQDNRITSDPMFCVFQTREIVVDEDYDHDRIVWIDEDGRESNERQRMRLELLHENFREPPEKWRRVALKEIDDFVTCCFTEKGCKDYLASNGHNLRSPYITARSGFRNAEYIGLRNWLAGIQVIEGEQKNG